MKRLREEHGEYTTELKTEGEYSTEHEVMREVLENKHGPKEKGPKLYSLTFSLERIRKKLMEVLRRSC